MSKVSGRRKRRKLSKLIKSFEMPKTRIPIAPPQKIFKSSKDYNRLGDKRKLLKVLKNDE